MNIMGKDDVCPAAVWEGVWEGGCVLCEYKQSFLTQTRARIFKRLWSPEIDSKEWIPQAYVAWPAGTITLFLLGS